MSYIGYSALLCRILRQNITTFIDQKLLAKSLRESFYREKRDIL